MLCALFGVCCLLFCFLWFAFCVPCVLVGRLSFVVSCCLPLFNVRSVFRLVICCSLFVVVCLLFNVIRVLLVVCCLFFFFFFFFFLFFCLLFVVICCSRCIV